MLRIVLTPLAKNVVAVASVQNQLLQANAANVTTTASNGTINVTSIVRRMPIFCACSLRPAGLPRL